MQCISSASGGRFYVLTLRREIGSSRSFADVFRVGAKSVGISAAVEVYLVSQWDHFTLMT